MSGDRLQQLVKQGDMQGLIRVGLQARRQAEEGIFCECEEPILTGADLMCGRCLRENQGQIDRRTERIRSPHPFEAGGETGIAAKMCRVCSGWEDDPRHLAPTPQQSGEGKG